MGEVMKAVLGVAGALFVFGTTTPLGVEAVQRLAVKMHLMAVQEINKPWGCPSLFNPKTACKGYNSTRYETRGSSRHR